MEIKRTTISNVQLLEFAANAGLYRPKCDFVGLLGRLRCAPRDLFVFGICCNLLYSYNASTADCIRCAVVVALPARLQHTRELVEATILGV